MEEPSWWSCDNRGEVRPARYGARRGPGEQTHAVVFAYEKRATMDYDFIAPARRVALFLCNRSFEKMI
jgi:hypothetical protein